MALTQVSRGLLSTSIVDNGNATAITIDSSENVGIGMSPTTNNISKSISLVNGGSIFGYGAGTYITGNSNYNGAWNTVATGPDSRILLDGNVVFSRSSSASAGSQGTVSESMRITSDGNLLVGKTSTGINTAGHALFASGEVFHSVAGTPLYVNRIGSNGPIQNFYKDGTSVGSIGVSSGAYLTIGTGDTGILFDNAGNRFYPCNASTQANLDATIDIGGSNVRFKDLYLSGRVEADGVTTTAVAWQSTSNSTSSSKHMRFKNPNGNVGDIRTNGSATAYITSSDYRLKENVVAMTGATERLKQLKPSRFNFIADAHTTVDGFLAHEVQDIVPEAIAGEKDAMIDEEYEVTPAVLDDDGNVITEAVMGTRSVPDYQGIDQSKLVPLLVATIQELEARITALETN